MNGAALAYDPATAPRDLKRSARGSEASGCRQFSIERRKILNGQALAVFAV